ncbi:hypothetical protein ACQPZJ_44310 [Actinoplanes sp. CA-054009]
MDYTEAVRAVREQLDAGVDELAAAGALDLTLQAWRHLADADRVWDQVGLELLDVKGRLYADLDVTVEADPPSDGQQTRAAVVELVEGLARHHERNAAAGGPFAQRLDHAAAAQQLHRAAAVLA